MKTYVLIAILLAAVCAPVSGFAHSGEHAELGAPDIHPVLGEDGVIELGNEKCLVSGEDVSGEHFLEHEGVRYAFCCKMCIKDFQKDPGKFALDKSVIEKAMAGQSQT